MTQDVWIFQEVGINSITLEPGRYFFELWGSEGGGGNKDLTGKGAYVSGQISLRQKRTIYIYLGDRTGRNGGGSASKASGGGSTDIRLNNSDTFDGYMSRIMVAAGGGGGVIHDNSVGIYTPFGRSGDGGSEESAPVQYYINIGNGDPSYLTLSTVATQTNGGRGSECLRNSEVCFSSPSYNGSFFKGGDGYYLGAGGGYFGGGGGNHGLSIVSFPTGGSSYISGRHGCRAINTKTSNTSFFDMKKDPYHDSGLYFTNTTMLSGNSSNIPTLTGSFENGHSGDGIARITYLGTLIPCTSFISSLLNFVLYQSIVCLIS